MLNQQSPHPEQGNGCGHVMGAWLGDGIVVHRFLIEEEGPGRHALLLRCPPSRSEQKPLETSGKRGEGQRGAEYREVCTLEGGVSVG